MLQVNPAYGQGYALIASQLVMNRRYDEGVAYYRKAIDLDPRLWSARSQLGINLIVLAPGEPMAMYHWEADQEDFLVLAG